MALRNTARKPGVAPATPPAVSAAPAAPHVALVNTAATTRRPLGPRDPNDELLTPEQVEAEFGLSRANLATWRTRGGGPRFLMPRPRRPIYRRSAIIEWLGPEVRTTAEAREHAKRATN
jgi:hypothetical protein